MLGRLFPGQIYHEKFVEQLRTLNGPSLEELMGNRGLCQNSVLWRARGVHCKEYGTLQGAVSGYVCCVSLLLWGCCGGVKNRQ